MRRVNENKKAFCAGMFIPDTPTEMVVYDDIDAVMYGVYYTVYKRLFSFYW
jgi:hypothetical protein